MARNYETYSESTVSRSAQQSNMKRNLIVTLILAFIVLIIGLVTMDVVTVAGNELGVKETWSSGVEKNPVPPGTHFMMPGWSQKVYNYDMSSHVFVMNNKNDHTEGTKGRETPDAYKIQSADSQDMTFHLNLRWRIDPTKLIKFHTNLRSNPEEKLIRPTIMRVVKDCATKRKAIDAYAGTGLVDLQTEIENKLRDPAGELSDSGVIVENFLIENIELDPEYISQIKAKQVAQLKQLALVEEQKAAEAQALVAKSVAQADYNKRVVEAEAAAKVQVTQAQADNERAVIAAKAEAEKRVLEAKGAAEASVAQAKASKETQQLEAEGKKVAMVAVAEGTLAQGKAEALAKELMLKAWAVPGADQFVKVEVAKSLGTAYSGVKGFLPADMKLNILTDSYMTAVDAATGTVIPVTGKK